MSDLLLLVLFVAGVAVSLAASWLLVARLERMGQRLGLSDALLGLIAALAADAPEITAAVTALLGNSPRIGAGVVIGSNVFNLAALLGLAAVVAGRIALHRRVIAAAGAVALWIAVVCVAVVSGELAAAAGLALVLAALAIYVIALALSPAQVARLPLPAAWTRWLAVTVREEELELHDALDPRRGTGRDLAVAGGAVLVVIAASAVMEHSAAKLGARHGIAEIVTGAFVLAAVTSLPNAVAAVYLALRGRGSAVLSTALNSNALNVAAGLLIPGTIVGLGAPSSQSNFVAFWYLGLTALALIWAYVERGLTRTTGAVILVAYAVFAVWLIARS